MCLNVSHKHSSKTAWKWYGGIFRVEFCVRVSGMVLGLVSHAGFECFFNLFCFLTPFENPKESRT